ncbi:MAG: hypothetical protein ACWA5A_14200 [Marinibacterium sp.]
MSDRDVPRLAGLSGTAPLALTTVVATALAVAAPGMAQHRTSRASPVDNAAYIARLDADFPFSDMIRQVTAGGCTLPYATFETAFNAAARSVRNPNVRKGGGTHIARAELPALRQRGLVEFLTPDQSMIRIRQMGNCP